jgi:hypothetical protein
LKFCLLVKIITVGSTGEAVKKTNFLVLKNRTKKKINYRP